MNKLACAMAVTSGGLRSPSRIGRVSACMALLLVVLALSSIDCVEGGNCSRLEPIYLHNDGTLYNISGERINVHPKLDGVVQYDVVLGWAMSLFIERDKVNHTAAGVSFAPGVYVYSAPDAAANPFDPTVDPLEPYVPNKVCTNGPVSGNPCGPVLKYYRLTEMDCWAEHIIAPFHGRTRESVYIHYTHPSSDGFQFISEHHMVDSEISIPRNNSGWPIVEDFYPNSLKVAYQWMNFPWVGSNVINTANLSPDTNNGSTFEFWFDFELTMPYDCEVILSNMPLTRAIEVHGWSKPVSLAFDVKSEYLIDGYGYPDVGPVNLTTRVNSSYFDVRNQIRIPVKYATVGHWQQLEYDPHLGSLFTADPVSPPQQRSLGGKFAAWKAIVIAVSIVVVVVAVLAVAYVFHQKQKFRNPLKANNAKIKPATDEPAQRTQPRSASLPAASKPSSPTPTPTATATPTPKPSSSSASNTASPPPRNTGWTLGTKSNAI